MDEQLYITKLIPYIKKYLKKHPITGMVERDQWFQFHYKVKGIKFVDDDYSWRRRFYVNIEVSDKYWELNPESKTPEWNSKIKYYWSARRRNQYIRTYVGENLKTTFDLFSIPTRIEIGKIKMVD